MENDWIECNLHWNNYQEEYPQCPELVEEIKEKFNIDIKQFTTQKYYKYKELLEKLNKDNSLKETFFLNKKLKKLINKEMEKNPDPDIIYILNYYDLENFIEKFKYKHPIYKKWSKEMNRIDKEYREMDSFCKRKLNKPGTLIEITGNFYQGHATKKNETRIILIGHTNDLAASEGGYPLFSDRNIVNKYKVILYFEDYKPRNDKDWIFEKK
jgi:hypothetical protein